MNDLISRAAALNALLMSKDYRDAHDALEQLPAVDAAPVVRCKDCKYYNITCCSPGFGWCERSGHNHGTTDDWFCADGERADAPTCDPDYCEIGGGDDADG